MKRTIEQWRKAIPLSVFQGGKAQVTNYAIDAQSDLLELFEQNLELRIQLRIQQTKVKAIELINEMREDVRVLNGDTG